MNKQNFDNNLTDKTFSQRNNSFIIHDLLFK